MIICELGPNGKCPEDCYTNDGPLCDFDKCPYENEADKKNGIKTATGFWIPTESGCSCSECHFEIGAGEAASLYSCPNCHALMGEQELTYEEKFDAVQAFCDKYESEIDNAPEGSDLWDFKELCDSFDELERVQTAFWEDVIKSVEVRLVNAMLHIAERYSEANNDPDSIMLTFRPSKDIYYCDIAKAVAARSTCIRRNYGAVIVKDDRIVSTGYNGSPRGMKNCCDVGHCIREEMGIPSGERYELCVAVHAEQNAIMQAGFQNTNGATLYLAGIESGGTDKSNIDCCLLCKRAILNAGIERIVFREPDGVIRSLCPSAYWGDAQ